MHMSMCHMYRCNVQIHACIYVYVWRIYVYDICTCIHICVYIYIYICVWSACSSHLAPLPKRRPTLSFGGTGRSKVLCIHSISLSLPLSLSLSKWINNKSLTNKTYINQSINQYLSLSLSLYTYTYIYIYIYIYIYADCGRRTSDIPLSLRLTGNFWWWW